MVETVQELIGEYLNTALVSQREDQVETVEKFMIVEIQRHEGKNPSAGMYSKHSQ